MKVENIIDLMVEKQILLSVKAGQLSVKAAKGALTGELTQLLKANKAEIIEYLQAHSSKPTAALPLITAKNLDDAPLSFAQQSLWFIDRLQGGSSEYNMPGALKVTGEFDSAAASSAINHIIERHQVLRTVYLPTEDDSVQAKVLTQFNFSLAQQAYQTDAELEQLLAEHAAIEFNLSEDVMVRASYFVKAGSENTQGALAFNIHHIASDGWSMGLFVKEFVGAYQSICRGEPVSLAPLPLQYGDYAHWQRDNQQKLRQQQQYWTEQLADVATLHSLPLDKPRPKMKQYVGAKVTTMLDKLSSSQLQRLAKSLQMTPFMLLHGALALVLARQSFSDDIVIGTPVANRQQPEIADLIGFFVNTVVLRLDVAVAANGSIADFLAQVKKTNIDAQANQAVPFDQLVGLCNVPRSNAHSPLFQMMFTMDNQQSSDIVIGDTRFAPIGLTEPVAKFDLDISATIDDKGLAVDWVYDVALFASAQIETLAAQLQTLLQRLAQLNSETLQTTCIAQLTELDKVAQPSAAANQVEQQFTSLQRKFEQQVALTPEATALIFNDQSLTFNELNQKANGLAQHLRAHGVVADALVGVYVERSATMVIALLAILKAGGAYLPLDPNYPAKRTLDLLEDAKPVHLLVQQDLVESVTWPAYIEKTELDKADVDYCGENLAPLAGYDLANLAYVIYTSGSTGRPKGVMVEMQNLMAYEQGFVEQLQTLAVSDNSPWLWNASFAFDASVKGLLSLCHGRAVVMATEAMSKDAEALTALIAKHQIEIVNASPLMAGAIIEALTLKPDVNPHFIVGGEKLSDSTHQQIIDYCHTRNTKAINAYGPTETTVNSSYGLIGQDCSIGRALPNYQLYVLDRAGNLLPQGAVGELYIGGAGVTRGYLNLPQQSEQAFVDLPQVSSSKLYRSGDLVRMLANGELVFIGRADKQLSVRGYRIEPAEIERQLVAIDAISQAVVLVQQSASGQSQLVAYVASQTDATADLIDSCRHSLLQVLPDYMVPAHFVVLAQIPLTVNGKVDQKALLQLKSQSSIDAANSDYQAASNENQRILVAIWAELLGLSAEKVSIDSNFFSLGGDSILSIQMASRAAKQGLHFNVKDVFDAQTIRQLAVVAKAQSQIDIPQQPVTGTLELLPVQRQFFQDETQLEHYNQALMLNVPQWFDEKALKAVLSEIINHHDALRLRFAKQDDHWQAEFLPFDQDLLAQAVVVRSSAPTEADVAFHQRNLSLQDGHLLKAVLYKNRLLLVIHHLVVDGVSWRILLEDLELLLRQYQQKASLQLPNKTTSLQSFAEQLQAFSQSDSLLQQQQYWQDIAATPMQSLAIATPDKPYVEAKVSMALAAEPTELLVGSIGDVYRTSIVELLLAALLQAYNTTTGFDELRLNLESHGRHQLPQQSEVDLGRTVGWFTSIYPLKLRHDFKASIDSWSQLISAVKNHYRQLPTQGIGYGLLQQLEVNCDWLSSELVFNYLGQLDSAINQQQGESLLSPASESVGPCVGELRRPLHDLALNGGVTDGRLQFSLTFDDNRFDRAQMQQLMDNFAVAIESLIAHCQSVQFGAWCMADFPLAKLESNSLNDWQLATDQNIEDIYPATGMQQGLLFHSLLASGSYVSQTLLTFDNLDLAAFKQAWQQVINRHVIFRTAFVGMDSGNAHQLVYREAQLPWRFEDLSHLDMASAERQFEAIRLNDKREGFVHDCAPLMRMTLVTLDDSGKQRLIWSHHHALLDGWCLPLVFGEVIKAYGGDSDSLQSTPVYSYRDYVAWLQLQSQSEAEAFWQQQLAVVEAMTPLPLATMYQQTGVLRQQLLLDTTHTAQLQRLAQSVGTTVNVLVQAAWGLLLSRYSGESTVVFGATSSGRPATLAGVEQMVGLFINSLPVVVTLNENDSLSTWLQAMHQQLAARESFNFVPLQTINKLSGISGALFDSLLVFENYPVDEAIGSSVDEAALPVSDVESYEGSDYGLSMTAHLSNVLSIKFEAQAHSYDATSLQQVCAHFNQLLLSLAALAPTDKHSDVADCKIKQLSMLSEGDRQKLLHELNPAKAPIAKPQGLIHHLFEAQVEQTPANIAVMFENATLSYQQLNQAANRLAHHLIAQGISHNQAVGICLPRGIDMVVAVLAVLKAGAAYVPLDAGYPANRLRHIVEDTQMKLLLTAQSLVENFADMAQLSLQRLDDEPLIAELEAYADSNPSITGDAANTMAYIIYTSGSTGMPKGVMVNHLTLQYSTNTRNDYYHNSADNPCRFLLLSPLAFDSSIAGLFSTLTSGGSLCVGADVLLSNPNDLVEQIRRRNITQLLTTPSLYDVLLDVIADMPLPSLNCVIVAGEACSTAVVNKHYDYAEAQAQTIHLYNEYGPTEATVWTTAALLQPNTAVSIGRPIRHAKVYVVDEHLALVPFGAVGQLLIGGEAISMGYLNQPQLTAEKFIDDVFDSQSGHKLYLSGDLVQFKPNGELNFIGRMDEQVKIRGLRVELSEIEAYVLDLPSISANKVMLLEGNNGRERLVAFIAAEKDQIAANYADSFKQTLGQSLPEHMIPDVFVLLEQLPLTHNGKVDSKALKAHFKHNQPAQNVEHQAASIESEKVLVAIWAELLQIDAESLSVNSNFFELGGDSILSIQAVSRAARSGLHFSVKDLFAAPTIKTLAALAKQTSKVVAPQGPVSGELQLLPIQQAFFHDEVDIHHFNQAVMLKAPADFSFVALQAIFNVLIRHHDALRLQFNQNSSGKWQAQHQDSSHDLLQQALVHHKWQHSDYAELEAYACEVQTSLEPRQGRMLKAVFIEPQAQSAEIGGRLLLVVHHLVVDGVSWRILLEDFERLYQQWQQNQALVLNDKTSSYQQWGAFLTQYSQSDAIKAQRDYWLQAFDIEVSSLSQLFAPAHSAVNQSTDQVLGHASFTLDKNHTSQLLSDCNSAYGTQINELLLAAWLLAVNMASGKSSVRVDLESHGRHPLTDSLDLSRTVGWFTSVYPLTLSVAGLNQDLILDHLICTVKEQCRAVPQQGMGFGLLQQLTDDQAFAELPQSEVLFNYLGQFDQVVNDKTQLTMAAESTGLSVSLARKPTHSLALNGGVSQGQLRFGLNFNPKHYPSDAMQALMDTFATALKLIVEHCAGHERLRFTPSDFSYSRLSQPSLDTLPIETSQVERLYIATPMQSGMVFHGLLDGKGVSYTSQTSLGLNGKLDVAAFSQAWQQVIARHDIFRTGFVAIESGDVHQLVWRELHLPIETLDWRADWRDNKVNEQDLITLRRQQKQLGFDFAKPPLMRILLVQLADDKFEMIWSHHHVLLDGWCTPVIFKEVMYFYHQACDGEAVPPLADTVPYEQYIGWLYGQDIEKAKDFWQQYLAELDSGCLISQVPLYPKPEHFAAKAQHKQLVLDQQQTAQLQQLVVEHQCTMNVLLQVAWGYLLRRYCGQDDVVFGTTISGRPAQLAGVEQMIGLFINTLPVRINFTELDDLSACLAQLHQDTVARDEFGYLALSDIQNFVPDEQLFDSLLVFENLPTAPMMQSDDPDSQALDLTIDYSIADEQTNYALTLIAHQNAQLHLKLQYSSHQFNDDIVIDMLAQLKQILLGLCELKPQQSMSKLSLLSEAQQQVLVNWAQPAKREASDEVRPPCIHHWFERQAQQNPDQIALTQGEVSLSYAELDQQANILANHIGITRAVVALYQRRSIEMVISQLAVLKAGAAYIPVDPDQPFERSVFMLKDSLADLLIGAEQDLAVLTDVECERLALEDCQTGDSRALAAAVHYNDPAYILYTSGTSGQPKGVMVSHLNVTSLLKDCEFISINQDDVLLHLSSPYFDAATFEIWGAWLNGAQLVIAPSKTDKAEKVLQAAELQALLVDHQVSVLWLTRALFDHYYLQQPQMFASLNYLLIGGEALTPELVNGLANASARPKHIINGYGPTEATVFTTSFECQPHGDSGAIPLGKPVDGRQCLVLDASHNLLPIGVPGQLYIAGAGVARGYLNQPDLTKDKFNHYKLAAKEYRLYQSGDKVCWSPDGQLHYLGRLDRQLKINGYRIEVSEIEQALIRLPQLRNAAVVAWPQHNSGSQALAAYVVADPQFERNPLFEQGIIDALAQQLPRYMLPASVTILPELPRTSNGKLDHRALPQPSVDANEFVAASTQLERQLVNIWQQVLDIETIGVTDNFFALGGNSIRIMELSAAINQQLQLDIPMAVLFERPTIAAISQVAAQARYQRITVHDSSRAPLSFAQQRQLFIESFAAGKGANNSAYHIPFFAKIKAGVEWQALFTALQQVVARHQVLNSVYLTDETGGSYQQVLDSELEVGFTQVADETQLFATAQQDIVKPFALDSEAAIRLQRYGLADEEYLLLVFHHIAFDGWSLGVFISEFIACFSGARLEPLEISYGDFARWQQDHLQGQTLARLEDYWHQQLAGFEVLKLPLDKPRPAQFDATGATTHFTIDVALSNQLRELAKQHQTTLYTVMLSAFYLLLARVSGQRDIVVGSPSDNRSHPQTQGLIGFFVNTLALRTEIDLNQSVEQLIANVHEVVIQAKVHQDLPFERLVESLTLERDTARHPLFDVMFSLQSFGQQAVSTVDESLFELVTLPQTATATKFDIDVQLNDGADGISGQFIYATALFDSITIDNLIGQFKMLLNGFVAVTELANETQTVGQLPLLTEAQHQQMVFDWNQTDHQFTPTHSLISLFDSQVQNKPDEIAVVCDDTRLSYQQLNQQVEQLASHILSLNDSVNPLIALYLDRSIEMCVSILAVLKAGGAYVPVSPDYPQSRSSFILKDTGTSLVLTSKRYHQRLSAWCQQDGHSLQLLSVDEPQQVKQAIDWAGNQPRIQPDHLAYVIYTSGTTGNPKGVMVTQGNVLHYFNTLTHRLKHAFRAVDFSSNYCFDLSVTTSLCPLLAGQTLYVYSGEASDIEAYRQHIKTHQPAFVKTTPSLARVLLAADDVAVESLMVGGEALTQSCIAELQDSVTYLFDEYGPTEATVGAGIAQVLPTKDKGIGKAYDNVRYYVLDELLNPVPVGTPGELYIGGLGVAKGYLNLPELTTERFIDNPFIADDSLYKTGDLVSYLKDGELEYHGRSDDQIKLRGYRIELGEIEKALSELDSIAQAVVQVIAKGDDKLMVAYVVGSNGAVDITEIKAQLAGRLPPYMVPQHFKLLASLPLTNNGKVNHKALPAIEFERQVHRDFVAPRNGLEQALAVMWQQQLQLSEVGVKDNFFDIGGNSLMAMQLYDAFHKKAWHMSMADLYRCPTIELLALHIDKHYNGSQVAANKASSIVSLNQSSASTHLFCLPPGGGNFAVYQSMATELEDVATVYGLEAVELFSQQAIGSYGQWIDAFIAQIRSVQPHGPYHLCGWSLGARTAYEVAARFKQLGEEVAYLALFDGNPVLELNPEYRRHWYAEIYGMYTDLEVDWHSLDDIPADERIEKLMAFCQTEELSLDGMSGLMLEKTFHYLIELNVCLTPYITTQTDLAMDLFIATDTYQAIVEQTDGQGVEVSENYGWEQVTSGKISRHELATDHMAMFRRPKVIELAQMVKSQLQQIKAVVNGQHVEEKQDV